MKSIKWGIIGCGDVTEIKSGPAFNKAENSELVAVMRRNAEKAEDYAKRHNVPKWYNEAQLMINDPDINAIYIATPPLYHEEYTLAALKAGKPVYVEKPVTINEASCIRMANASVEFKTKLSVAHYRRALPVFNKVKDLLETKAVGDVRFVNLQMLQPDKSKIIANSEENWRIDPAISGGGLFHDLAPHQLDLMLYYFGEIKSICGTSANQAGFYQADDIVSGNILFESGVIFQGLWCFSVHESQTKDMCEIIGSKGKISFPIFGSKITMEVEGNEQIFDFVNPQHIQQPMIQQVVDYFLGKGNNPCSAEQATEVMQIMDTFTR
ncbi:MAG: oxidoreductase [Daejeonella sp.]|nr:oxidoreductase [Daejeonella sp.]